MSKRRPKPLIVTARLDETVGPFVQELSNRTGWSINRALSHMLAIAIAHNADHDATLHMLRRRFETASAEKHIREDAAAKIKAIRQAEAKP